MPTIEILQQTNPDFDRERLLDLVALYRGGKCFTNRARRFLPQNEHEPESRYATRLGSARYFNYIGPIIDRFAAALIQAPPSLSKGNESIPDNWKAWQSNVDGLGTDLSELARETITDAMMKGRTFLVVEKPAGDAATMAEWNERGLGNVRVRELETQDVIDWGCDENGQLAWLIHHCHESPRPDPLAKRTRCVETWTVYDTAKVDVYRIEYEHGNRPGVETEVPLYSSTPHGLGRIPVVPFDVSEGMWLAERAYDAQVEHFTQRSALGWALKASCYAMPVFHLEDGTMPPTMGTGLGLMLGMNDKVDYLAPPAQPFDVVADAVASCREEIYRIVHQMAEGISSKASATARSGDSKKADLIATNTILEAYAVVLRDALAKACDLAFALRGEDFSGFSIAGMDEFSEPDLKELFESVEKGNAIGMPSDTYQLKAREMLLDAQMPQLPESDRGKIIEELSSGLAELKKKDELERQYQQALAHALTNDAAGQRQAKPAPNAGGNGGGSAAIPAKKAPPGKPNAQGAAKPRQPGA